MIQTRQTTPAAPPPAPQMTVVERMAETMREMRGAGQTVTAEALAIFGDYTAEEIAEYGMEAGNRARELMTRDLAA